MGVGAKCRGVREMPSMTPPPRGNSEYGGQTSSARERLALLEVQVRSEQRLNENVAYAPSMCLLVAWASR